jgi:hypothetical protein
MMFLTSRDLVDAGGLALVVKMSIRVGTNAPAAAKKRDIGIGN